MSRAAFIVERPTPAALRAINYTPELQLLAGSRRGRFQSVPLRTLLLDFGRSYWSVFTRRDCESSHGVELVTQSDMFAAEPVGRVIRIDSMPRPPDHEVKRWQILIAGAGQMSEGNLFGRSVIADGRLAGKYLGPHAVALGFKEPGEDINLWSYAFLSTRLGIKAIQACAFGTSVPGLRLDLLGAVPIPIPKDTEHLTRVASLIRRCVEQRETYHYELRAARRIIDDLLEMREAHAMCLDQRVKFVVWKEGLPTIRAWNYAAAGHALGFLRQSWRGRLRDLLVGNGVFKGDRFTRVPCEPPRGIGLLSQRDVFSIRAMPRFIQRPSVDLTVRPSMILMASRGQMNEDALFGHVERGVHMPHGVVVTEDITRVEVREGLDAVLYAFLSTTVGQMLLRTTAYGTSIPGMRIDLLRDIPIPDLTDQRLRPVAKHIERSSRARVEASEAESEAIRIIEEEVLPSWLA